MKTMVIKFCELFMKLVELVVWCLGWLYRLVLKTLEFLKVITNKIISVAKSLIAKIKI